MNQEQLDLINKVQILAQELAEDVYSSPFDISSVRYFLEEIQQTLDVLENYNQEEE